MNCSWTKCSWTFMKHEWGTRLLVEILRELDFDWSKKQKKWGVAIHILDWRYRFERRLRVGERFNKGGSRTMEKVMACVGSTFPNLSQITNLLLPLLPLCRHWHRCLDHKRHNAATEDATSQVMKSWLSVLVSFARLSSSFPSSLPCCIYYPFARALSPHPFFFFPPFPTLLRRRWLQVVALSLSQCY